jgi:hypothetical protein
VPLVLRRLMRHASVQTTEAYYVDIDAAEVTDELWAKFGQGDKSGDTAPKRQEARQEVTEPNPLS